MTDVEPAVFRQLCGRFPTGITVVTAVTLDGRPVGMTANSFTAVSLTPPLVSVNIDHVADMHRHLLHADRFALNVLASHQETLSRWFAGEDQDKFTGIDWHAGDAGVPILGGVLAVILCDKYTTFEAGDHTVVVGRVTGGQAGDGRPLLYWRGGYYDVPLG
jgi:flavin reductase (DIM6/NTAB) family NADH-FMN oxidoreductase RutF